jgi:uncharacterized protein (TIGR03437 family)
MSGIGEVRAARVSARGVALLALLFAVLVAPGLQAQTSIAYPVGSSPVGVAFDGTYIWVANSNSNNVTKLLATTGATVGTYAAGTGPEGIAFDGENIWVVNDTGTTKSGAVTKILTSTGAIVGGDTVGKMPIGVAFDGANIWVASCNSNSVTKLLASNGAIAGTYSTGYCPWAVAFDGANIWVANSGNGSVTKLLASTGALMGTYTVGGGPSGIAFDGTNIWVANAGSNTVTKLLASSGGVVGVYPAGTEPQSVAFDGTSIWVTNLGSNTVTELLASTGALVGTYSVGRGPGGIAFDGTSIWVANFNDSTVTKISPASQPTTTTLSVTSLSFGNESVDITSAPQTVTMTNIGTSALDINGISIAGTNSADYAETNTCGGSLAASTSCSIFVTFTPTATGARTASINVTDNASNSPQTISLTGTGQEPSVPTPSVAGSWSFLAQSSIYTVLNCQSGGCTTVPAQFSAAGILTQNGNSFSGTLTISGTACATSAGITGSLSGDNFTASVNENGQIVTFTGTVSGNSATGSYTTPSGGCTNGDQGIWTATRAANIPTGGVVSSASYIGPVSPGSLISIFGTNLASAISSGFSLPLPTSFSGTSVTINGISCPLLYVSPSQINAQVPYGVTIGTATVVVTANGSSGSATATIASIAPGIFADSSNRGAISFNSSGAPVTPSQPANAGDFVVIYGTGTGPLTVTPGTGQAAGSGASLSTCTSAVSVTMNGLVASIPFCGLAPGFVGLMQVDAAVPAGLPAGDVPIVLTIGGVAAPTTIMAASGR